MTLQVHTDSVPRGTAIERASATIDRAIREGERRITLLSIGPTTPGHEEISRMALSSLGELKAMERSTAQTAPQAFAMLSCSRPDAVVASVSLLSNSPAGIQTMALLREHATTGCRVVFVAD